MTIDLEMAKKFLEDVELDVSEARDITDEAAEVLSKCKWQLMLSGLTELSDTSAESLSKHEGYLSLDGLTEFSDAAAESLSKHKGSRLSGCLSLNGLSKLSDAAAESLSKFQGGDLVLDGLPELSDAAAKSFSKHEGYLSLDGLTELSDAAAESLSKHNGRLALDSLTKISDTAAALLLGQEKLAGASESLAEENTVELVTEIIVEQLSITADQVRPDSKIIEDLGADFTDAVELVMAVEEEFGIEVPDEEAEKFISVSDIISYVEKALLRNSESKR